MIRWRLGTTFSNAERRARRLEKVRVIKARYQQSGEKAPLERP